MSETFTLVSKEESASSIVTQEKVTSVVSTGYQGPAGPQGIQGIQGIQGPIGLTGPQGIQGAGFSVPYTYDAGTLTTDQKVLDLSATWNNAAITYTGVKFDVADTSSNSSSLLLDLQIAGVSKFNVGKTGQLSIRNTTSTGTIDVNGSGTVLLNATNVQGAWVYGDVRVQSGALNFNGDTVMLRENANILAQRNSTNPQAFNIYNTYTDASNYERVDMKWSGGSFLIDSTAAGTGIKRKVSVTCSGGIGNAFSVDPSFMSFSAYGSKYIDFYAPANKLQFRSGLSIAWQSTTVANAATAADVGISRRSIGSLNVTDGSTGLGAIHSSAIRFGHDTSGLGSISGYEVVYYRAGSPMFRLDFEAAVLPSTGKIAWTDTSSPNSGTRDLFLSREANGILAQRNGINPQSLHVYNTYTDANNYERGCMKWDTNVLMIGSEFAGTGTYRDVKIKAGGAIMTLSGGSYALTLPGNLVLPQTYIASGAGFIGLLNGNATSGVSLQLREMISGITTPDADHVRIYAEDNGLGKTRLMVQFATGAPIQLAIEP